MTIGIDQVRGCPYRRDKAFAAARDQRHAGAVLLDGRDGIGLVVVEGRIAFLVVDGQGHLA
jgi:hypothetical protein